MKQRIIALSLLTFIAQFLFTTITVAANDSPTGKWRTIDDATGKAKSIIAISENDGVFSGIIESLLNPSEPNPLCKKCSGERADQPILGMTILWDVTSKNDYWSGGKILDPKKGKTYKVKLSLIEDGMKLKVRGYIGTPVLGRTQVWERITD